MQIFVFLLLLMSSNAFSQESYFLVTKTLNLAKYEKGVGFSNYPDRARGTTGAKKWTVLKRVPTEDIGPYRAVKKHLWGGELSADETIYYIYKKFVNEENLSAVSIDPNDTINEINKVLAGLLNCQPPGTREKKPINTYREIKKPKVSSSSNKPYPAPNKNPTPALAGAYKVMATMFQSCEALYGEVGKNDSIENWTVKKSGWSVRTLPSENIEPYIDGHYILSRLKKLKSKGKYPSEKCENILQQPPIYAYGQKFEAVNGRMNLNFTPRAKGWSKKGHDVTAIDCSGFIAAAFAAKGLQFLANPEPEDAHLEHAQNGKPGVWWFQDLPRLRNSCMNHSGTNAETILKPGDVVNYYGSKSSAHVVMIDKVGEDPLGIEKRQNNCEGLTPFDFNFSYLHSGSLRHQGPGRVNALVSAKRGEEWLTKLANRAIKICKKRYENGDFSIHKRSVPKLSILRHNPKKKGCVVKPTPIIGEQCVNSCL